MLPLDLVLEIQRLLDETELSRRAIARQLGVSRGVVNDIAAGRRALYGAKPRDGDAWNPPRDVLPSRCSGCGGKVFMPCHLCRTREFVRRQQTFVKLKRRNAYGPKKA